MPANCYEISNADAFVNNPAYPVNKWGLHALAWKAYKTPGVTYTPPGPQFSPAVPAGPPTPSAATTLAALEASAAVFADGNGQSVNPDGNWWEAKPKNIGTAMAYIALAVTRFDSPVYVEVGPQTGRLNGEIETFAVERLSIATAGQPMGDVCNVSVFNSWGPCLVGIGMWWTIGEVEGLAYFKGGTIARMTFSGADFTALMEESRPTIGDDFLIYSDADFGSGNLYSYYVDTADWALGPHYDRYASAQGCPDQNLGDSVE